jgi:hypothetical protein
MLVQSTLINQQLIRAKTLFQKGVSLSFITSRQLLKLLGVDSNKTLCNMSPATNDKNFVQSPHCAFGFR